MYYAVVLHGKIVFQSLFFKECEDYQRTRKWLRSAAVEKRGGKLAS